jgi:hypothetical protein
VLFFAALGVRVGSIPWSAMDRARLPDPDIRIDGARVRASSHLAYAGAYQLTLSTTVAALALELHSSYLGHPAGDAAVSHLSLAPDTDPCTHSELRPGTDLLVAERRGCLYDHLARLQELLVRRGGQVTIEIADGALELVETA